MFILRCRWFFVAMLGLTIPVANAVEPTTGPFGAGPLAQATTGISQIALPEKNLSFDLPPSPWNRSITHKIATDTCLEFSRTKPRMNFGVIAEVPSPSPDATTAEIVNILLDRVSAKATDFSLVEKTKQTIDGVTGIRACVRATVNNKETETVYWVYAAKHGVYQMLASADANDGEQLRAQAAEMFQRMHFLDPALLAKTASLPPYVSSRYGYTVDLSKPGWLPLTTKARDATSPSADFFGTRDLYTVLMVVPVSLGGIDCDQDTLARALLSQMNFSFDEVSDVKQITTENAGGNAKGISFSFDRDVNDTHYDYRVRMLTANGYGYLVAAWTSKAKQIPRLTEVLDSFSINKTPPPVALDYLSLRERSLHVTIFNEMGNIESGHARHAQAAVLHLHALQLRTDLVVLENAVSDYENAQQSNEALQLVRKYKDQLSKRPSLLLRAARLEASIGDRDSAIDLYKQVFASANEPRGVLRAYTHLLIKANRADEALEVVRHNRIKADATEAAIIESEIQLDKNETDKAITVLLDRKVTDTNNSELNFALTRALLKAKRYAEAKVNAQVMIDQGSKSPWVYEQLGVAQYDLKAYRDAKATLEAALALDPENEHIKSWLREASGMLGEGDNASIKTEITAVPVPAELLAVPALSAGFGSDANAIYLSSVHAISFEKDKEQKSTQYYTIKVLNAAGVDEFNSFRFSFDPGSEQLYVNKLEVKDADGKLTAAGRVADCYTQDNPHEQSASFSRTLHIPVPGLKPGCTIELILSRKQLYTGRLDFSENLLSFYSPCAVSTVFVRGDLNQIKATASDGLQRQNLADGWCWTAHEPQPFSYEAMRAEYELYLPMVTLVDASASWEQLGTEYLSTIKDVIKPDPEALALANKLTQGLDSPDKKLAAILAHVQHEVTYQAIEFGRRARVPNKAGQIIHNHYGDCKDHALLLDQLLNAAGIPSQLVLVRTGGPLNVSTPSMDQFDHMIVCTPGKTSDGDRYFDCTDKDLNLNMGVPYGLGGKQVLQLDPEHPRLAAIPEYAPGSSVVNIARDESLNTDGDLTIQEAITCKGYYASTMRSSFRLLDPKDRKPEVHDMLSERGHVDLAIESVNFDNLDRVDQPLVINVKYHLPHRFSRAGGGLVGSLPALFERSVMSPGHVEPRHTPFVIRYPIEYQVTSRLSVPESYRMSTAVEAYELNAAFESDRVSIKAREGGLIEETFTGRSNPGQYPAQAYRDYERGRHDLLAAVERNLVLLPKESGDK